MNILYPSEKVPHRILGSRNAALSSLKSICLLSPLDRWSIINISALPRWNLAGPSNTRKLQRGDVFKAAVFTRARLAACNVDLCRFKWNPGYEFPSTSLQGTSTVMMSDVQSASRNPPSVFTLLQSHCGRGPESRVQQEIEREMEEIRT